MIQNMLEFKENMVEDTNQHLKRFLQLCDTFKYNGVSDDVVRLRLFPFLLCDSSWLGELIRTGSNTTWNDLAERFSIIIQLRWEITNFKQHEGESLYEARERFKTMLRNASIMDCKYGSYKYFITVLMNTSNRA